MFRDLEEDFDKMRRRQHELGVSHGPVCQVSETVEVSRVPAVLRDAALEDLFHEVCLRHQARGGGKGPQLRKKSGVEVRPPREFTLADANSILGLHNTKVKVKPLVADDLVDPHCLASKKSLMLLYTAFLPEKTLMETVTDCVEINQCVGCTRQSFTKSFLGDDAAALARSSGKEPTSPRHRAGVASTAWRSTWRFRTSAP